MWEVWRKPAVCVTGVCWGKKEFQWPWICPSVKVRLVLGQMFAVLDTALCVAVLAQKQKLTCMTPGH